NWEPLQWLVRTGGSPSRSRNGLQMTIAGTGWCDGSEARGFEETLGLTSCLVVPRGDIEAGVGRVAAREAVVVRESDTRSKIRDGWKVSCTDGHRCSGLRGARHCHLQERGVGKR